MNVPWIPVLLKNLRPTEMPLTRWDKLGSNCRIQESEKKRWGKNIVERGHKHQRRKLRRDTFLVMESVRGIQVHMDQICPTEKIQKSYVASCHNGTWVNVGHVPGYRPIRRAPINVKPDEPSEKVVLPAISPNRSCNPTGDISEDERSCGWRVWVACQRKYTEEGALRRFKCQNTERQY